MKELAVLTAKIYSYLTGNNNKKKIQRHKKECRKKKLNLKIINTV